MFFNISIIHNYKPHTLIIMSRYRYFSTAFQNRCFSTTLPLYMYSNCPDGIFYRHSWGHIGAVYFFTENFHHMIYMVSMYKGPVLFLLIIDHVIVTPWNMNRKWFQTSKIYIINKVVYWGNSVNHPSKQSSLPYKGHRSVLIPLVST